MERTYRYRIYPNAEQKVLMAKTFGCVRFVYNWALEKKTKAWEDDKKVLGEYELDDILTKELKNEYEWLREVNAQSLTYSIRMLFRAFDNFFKHGKNYPKFKAKDNVQKFQCPQHCRVDFKRGLLEIPKFKRKNAIKCVFHRKFKGSIKRVTICKECDGRYYAMIFVADDFKQQPLKPVTEDTTIGIDAGLKSFAVLSTGEEIPTPHFAGKQRKHFRRLHQSLDRKQKGSANYEKARLRLARLYSRVKNQREDFLHKLTYRLTHENQVSQICVEDLSIKNMAKNRHISFNLLDASLGSMYRQLEYKCRWYGVTYKKISCYAPSSKTCHVCGYWNGKLKWNMRTWTCPHCGTKLERDANAAINIKYFGLEALPMERGKVKPVEKPTMDDRALHLKSSVPMKQEKSRSNCLSEANEK